MESKLVVSTGTSHKSGEVYNKCEGCQHRNEQEEEHEEEPLMLTGWGKTKQKTEKEEEDQSSHEEKPLLPNFKY
jgi:hypothetical protein